MEFTVGAFILSLLLSSTLFLSLVGKEIPIQSSYNISLEGDEKGRAVVSIHL